MKMIHIVRLPILFGVLLLSACASLKPDLQNYYTSPEARIWQQRQAAVEALDNWDVKGKMSVRTQDDGGSATFIWQRKQSEHRIEMYGPFGGGRAVIEQTPSGATLRDNKKNEFEDKNAELLLYRRVGWHVPFNAMNYWLKGVPMPGPFNQLRFGEDGNAQSFQQDGWEIRYLSYTERMGMILPRKIFLAALPGTVHLVDEAGEDLGDKLEVKVVLRRWLPAE